MKVLFSRLIRGYWKKDGQWVPAILIAAVDGFKVRCIGNGPGWDCSCPNPDCDHVDTVADLVLPDVLRALESVDDTGLRPAFPGTAPAKQGRPKPSARRRKRSTTCEAEAVAL